MFVHSSTSGEAGRINGATLLVVAVCWLTIIFEGYDLIVYGTVAPALLHYKPWGLNAVQTGLIGSYAVIGMLFGALLAGTITDIVGRKITLISCVTIFSIFMGLCALAPSPALFGLCRFIAGLGLGGVIPTATAVTIEYAPPRWRTFTYTLMFTGYSVGGILASGLAIPLVPAFGFRVMFWFGVIPLLIVVPVAIAFLPESIGFLLAKQRRAEAESIALRFGIPLEPAVVRFTTQETEGVERSFSSKRFSGLLLLFSKNYILATVLFWLATFLALFMVFGLNTWLPQIMTKAGYSLGSALSFLLVLNVGTIVGMLFTGAATDRGGSKVVCVISFLLAAVSLGLLSIKLPLLVTYLLVAIAGIGTIGTQTLLNAYVSKYYPVHSRATAVGWSLGIGRLGGILGPSFGGLLLAWQLGVQWNFYSFAIPAFIGAGVILLLPRGRATELDIAVPAVASGVKTDPPFAGSNAIEF